MGLFTPNVAKLQDKHNVAGLVRALHAREGTVRLAAARALGHLADTAATEPLVAVAQEAEPDLRDAAITSLGQLHDPRAAELLVAGVEDDDLALRKQCADALRYLMDTCSTANGAAVRSAVTTTLARHPGAADRILRVPGKAQDYRHALQSAAVQATAQVGGPPAVDVLTRVVDDASLPRGVRDEAGNALGRLGGDAVEPLMAVLRGGSSDAVRRASAVALGSIGDPRAVEPLISALSHNTETTRTAAAVALGQIGDSRAVGPLVIVLGEDKNWRPRQLAASALGKIGDPRAVDPLADALRDQHDDVRLAAVGALEELGAVSIDVLVASLNDSHVSQDVRSTAARILGDFADPRVVEPLAAAMADKHGSVRRAAIIAVRRIGDPRAKQPLAREIDIEIKNLFGSPRQQPRSSLAGFVPVSALDAEVAQWAQDAAGYDVEWESGRVIDVQYVDRSRADQAIRQLCARRSPVTSNILHLVAQKATITVSLAACAFSQEEEVDFASQRETALRELQTRGNPSYRPEAYVEP